MSENQPRETIISFLLEEKKITTEQAYDLINNVFYYQLRIDLVQKLLDEKSITSLQAVILLKDSENSFDKLSFPLLKQDDAVSFNIETCPCNPKNGGSGICNCTLSQPKVIC